MVSMVSRRQQLDLLSSVAEHRLVMDDIRDHARRRLTSTLALSDARERAFAAVLSTRWRAQQARQRNRHLRESAQATVTASTELRLRLREERRRRAGNAFVAADGLSVLGGDSQLVKRTDGVLSRRQREILELIDAGYGTRDIARRLELSPATVRNHVGALMQALGVHSRIEALAVARERNLL